MSVRFDGVLSSHFELCCCGGFASVFGLACLLAGDVENPRSARKFWQNRLDEVRKNAVKVACNASCIR